MHEIVVERCYLLNLIGDNEFTWISILVILLHFLLVPSKIITVTAFKCVLLCTHAIPNLNVPFLFLQKQQINKFILKYFVLVFPEIKIASIGAN